MDSIRLSQVNEALNYDKNINAMVFNLEKKRTAMFPDAEVLPYSQIGEETMTTTKEGANSLKVLLRKRKGRSQRTLLLRPSHKAAFNPNRTTVRRFLPLASCQRQALRHSSPTL